MRLTLVLALALGMASSAGLMGCASSNTDRGYSSDRAYQSNDAYSLRGDRRGGQASYPKAPWNGGDNIGYDSPAISR